MARYKKFIDKKIGEISKEKTVLDVGGGEKFQKWLEPYKTMFAQSNYITMDVDIATGADIIGDIHNIPKDGGSVDAIICSSVLEHIRDPLKAVSEMRRVLKTGGKIFVYVPSIYPYHARKGSYPDYWRFFDDTITLLFKDFSHIEVEKLGGYFKALSFFFPIQHKARVILDPIADTLDFIFGTRKKTTTAGYFIYAIK